MASLLRRLSLVFAAVSEVEILQMMLIATAIWKWLLISFQSACVVL
jgi:hypothetical protein